MPSGEIVIREVLESAMADAFARISPRVLAAALQEIEGVELDLSTAEGEAKATQLVERLVQDSDSMERLLTALEKHGSPITGEVPLPAAYGPVAMEADALPSDPVWRVPPIGSAEFESFMSESSPAAGEPFDLVEVGQPAPPSLLGFAEGSVEPVSIAAFTKFDAIFLDVQRQLSLQARRAQREGFWARLASVFTADAAVEPPVRFTTQAIRNYTTVAARQGSATKVLVESLASGKVLFVKVSINGTIRMQDRITLADSTRAVQRFTEVFADEAEVGAEALHELRDANAAFLIGARGFAVS